MSKQLCKISVSEEHRHMIRLYMVHHRLPSMKEAAARMIEAVTETEGSYKYRPPKELVNNRELSNNENGERKAG